MNRCPPPLLAQSARFVIEMQKGKEARIAAPFSDMQLQIQALEFLR